MNPPQVYMCSPSWTLLPPPSPFHPSGLSFLAVLWNSAFSWVYFPLSPLPFNSLLFSSICKVSSDNNFAFLHFFSLGWFCSLPPVQCYKPPSIVLQALCLQDLIPWSYSSPPLYNQRGFDLGYIGHTWMDWKRSVFIPVPKKGNDRECSNYWTIALISHASKISLKILHIWLQRYVKGELPDVQAGFRKGWRIRFQITNICRVIEKARGLKKTKTNKTSTSLTTLKPLTEWITKNCGKFLKIWEYQTTLPVS